MNCSAVRFPVIVAMACVSAAVPCQAQQFSFEPFHKSGIYELGERAGWTATLAPGMLNYIIRKNNLDVIQTGTVDPASGCATIETTVDEPAMLYVEVLTQQGAGEPVAPIQLGPSKAPGNLQ